MMMVTSPIMPSSGRFLGGGRPPGPHDMTISIIIPLYNKAPFLERALESIRAQTFTDYEVIVVDDGSTDGGGTLVNALDDRRFRLIVQQNGGPGRARNRGLREASG